MLGGRKKEEKTPLLAGSSIPEPSRFDKDFRQVKCVVVGDGAVGKTCMLISFTTNTFPKDYVPTVFDNFFTNVSLEGQIVNFHLWDTAGQEEWDKLRYLAYPETDCFILCYDITNRDSLENIKHKWKPEIAQHRPGVPYVVVGTKLDLRTPKPPGSTTVAPSSSVDSIPPSSSQETDTSKKKSIFGKLKGKLKKKDKEKSFSPEVSDLKVTLKNQPTLAPESKCIPQFEGRRIASEIGAAEYMECSALTQESLRFVFETVIRLGVAHKYKPAPPKKLCPCCATCLIL